MGHRLVSLVIPPLAGSPLSTHQHYRFQVEDYKGDLVDFKGESGTTGIGYDTNIVCCALVAGLGCLCALSLFLQPKHQAFNIRSKTLFNKSRLCRYQLNLVLHLFCS
jgi:hypothetical protein